MSALSIKYYFELVKNKETYVVADREISAFQITLKGLVQVFQVTQ